MERVRIGLAGCGLFGESQLQAFRAVPAAQIAAVYDVERERAERADSAASATAGDGS